MIPTGRAWNWEIAYQTNGAPGCVFTVQRDNVTGTTERHQTTASITITPAGPAPIGRSASSPTPAARSIRRKTITPAASASIRRIRTVIYISSNAVRPFDLTTISNVPVAAHYELYRGTTADAGLSFSWRALTTNSTADNLRPVRAAASPWEARLLWLRGKYPSYTSFETAVVGLFQ